MKKILFMLLLLFGISAFGAMSIKKTGEFKKGESSYNYPSIALVYDDSDGKYDIYKYSWDHGFMLENGQVLTDKDFEYNLKNKLIAPFKYKGKSAKNLNLEKANKILEEMLFEEYKE
ncbi:hypothetical protein [Fusobacterium russii]|uniref:hypothetical protein n=1 Tax=Fusobacterium russii TaxID=854 RepID=UPI00039FFA06|nr:hypothetical protein [Fusobacterium russii]